MNRQGYDQSTMQSLGGWLMQKARRQQAEQGTFQAARNLKKQGVPLDFALDILVPLGRGA
jgi:hypothetical protein